MKSLLRSLSLVPLCLAVTTCLSAESPFSIGLRAGINFASASLDTTPPPQVPTLRTSTSSRTRFAGGAVLAYKLSEPLELQLEPGYVQRGTKVRFSPGGTIPPVDATVDLEYVELPLTFKVSFGSQAVRPYLVAGPNLGLRLSAEVDTPTGTENVKNDARKTDLAIDVGGGLAYQVNPKTFFTTELRYSRGLRNVFRNEQENGRYKSRDLKLLAGLLFRL